MSKLNLVLVVLVAISLSACTFFQKPVVVNNGPAVVKASVSIGMQIALENKDYTVEQASLVKGYILDARKLIVSGDAPATALDQLAAYLNENIADPVILAAIQQGIEVIKTGIKIPVTGVIAPEVKVWIFAVLDGAIQGCDQYIAGVDAPAARLSGKYDKVSFR